MLLTVLIVLGLVCVVAALFINFSPEFGGSHSESDKERYSESDNYEDGVFLNPVETVMDMGVSKMIGLLGDYIKGVPNAQPSMELPMERVTPPLSKDSSSTTLMWYGHSAFWLQMNGKNILLDPMLGDVPAPHPLLGRKRYSSELPISIDELPEIDAIIISHDHYDHLDYGSIQRLAAKTKHFYVPLGVGVHLEEWGVDSSKITEMDWWENAAIVPNANGDNEIGLTFTPSRHFSGRGLMDRFTTLWGSWVIDNGSEKLYFSGDSGYSPHFKEIGERLGPFDFAMLECGQYNEKWSNIHMMPEQTAAAARDIGAAVFMPIHWAGFTLALHNWDDPVLRVVAEAGRIGQPIIVPKIGQKVEVSSDLPQKIANYVTWW